MENWSDRFNMLRRTVVCPILVLVLFLQLYFVVSLGSESTIKTVVSCVVLFVVFCALYAWFTMRRDESSNRQENGSARADEGTQNRSERQNAFQPLRVRPSTPTSEAQRLGATSSTPRRPFDFSLHHEPVSNYKTQAQNQLPTSLIEDEWSGSRPRQSVIRSIESELDDSNEFLSFDQNSVGQGISNRFDELGYNSNDQTQSQPHGVPSHSGVANESRHVRFQSAPYEPTEKMSASSRPHTTHHETTSISTPSVCVVRDLIKSPPVYSQHMNIENWWRRIKLYVENNNVPLKEVRTLLLYYMDDDCSAMAECNLPRQVVGLEELGHEVIKLFGRLDRNLVDSLGEFYSRRQKPGEDVRTYMTELWKLAKEASRGCYWEPRNFDETVRERFVNGIANETVMMYVVQKGPSTSREALAMACEATSKISRKRTEMESISMPSFQSTMLGDSTFNTSTFDSKQPLNYSLDGSRGALLNQFNGSTSGVGQNSFRHSRLSQATLTLHQPNRIKTRVRTDTYHNKLSVITARRLAISCLTV
jgi:Ca2+/Na+ antiporter